MSGQTGPGKQLVRTPLEQTKKNLYMSTNSPVQLEATYLPAAVSSAPHFILNPARLAGRTVCRRHDWRICARFGYLWNHRIHGRIARHNRDHFDEAVTFAAVESLLGEKPTEIDSDVCDTVSELANMIAGGVKDHIKIEEIALGMPTTVSGQGHAIVFDTGAQVERVGFRTPVGRVLIQIAVRRGS